MLTTVSRTQRARHRGHPRSRVLFLRDGRPTDIADEIERYLRTGKTDPHLAAWSGGFMERAKRAHKDLRGALVREVRRLGRGGAQAMVDSVALTLGKVEPMVRGFFPRAEQDLLPASSRRPPQPATAGRSSWRDAHRPAAPCPPWRT